MGVPTTIPDAPSLINIFATTPSSSLSMLTTALSVCMSQRTSPAAMLSPSCLYHLTIVPSDIVGDKLGMLMAVPGVEPPDMARASTWPPPDEEDCSPTGLEATSFQSSPSSATTAIISPTLIDSESAAFTILARNPSSSTSILTTALSV